MPTALPRLPKGVVFSSNYVLFWRGGFNRLSIGRLYVTSNGRIIEELEWIWKEAVVDSLRYYPGIEENHENSATITGDLAEIRTELVSNASQELQGYVSLFDH
jgi:hypothetical protein